MHKRLLLLVITAAVAAGAACSSSSGPRDAFEGTWRVTMSAPGVGGTLTPDTFTAQTSNHQGTAVAVTMSNLTLSTGPTVFDNGSGVWATGIVRGDTLEIARGAGATNPNGCYFAGFQVELNAARDTGTGLYVTYDSAYHTSGPCYSLGTAQMVKK
jgi:hypothetical protein